MQWLVLALMTLAGAPPLATAKYRVTTSTPSAAEPCDATSTNHGPLAAWVRVHKTRERPQNKHVVPDRSQRCDGDDACPSDLCEALRGRAKLMFSELCQDASAVVNRQPAPTSRLSARYSSGSRGAGRPGRGRLQRRQCGVWLPPRPRVIGGSPAATEQWPWIARLGWRGGDWFCGGTLISERHLLTAAHCVPVPERPDNIIAWVAGSTAGVGRIRHHPRYHRHSKLHDLALITLQENSSQSDGGYRLPAEAVPICLPHQGSRYPAGTPATVAGWGSTGTARFSDALLEAAIRVVDTGRCEAGYRRRPHFWRDFPRGFDGAVLCAAAEGRDACTGDSGGPLVAPRRGRQTLIGVVSTGHGCAQSGYPGLYTAVAAHVDWVKQEMKREQQQLELDTMP